MLLYRFFTAPFSYYTVSISYISLAYRSVSIPFCYLTVSLAYHLVSVKFHWYNLASLKLFVGLLLTGVKLTYKFIVVLSSYSAILENMHLYSALYIYKQQQYKTTAAQAKLVTAHLVVSVKINAVNSLE